ncbi:MAG: hypothetical protein ACYTFV_02605, partial [Planctomycetota bacterium]
SLTLLHGDTAGKLFALSVPNALVKEQPSFGENEGLSTFSAVLGADTYTGDTGTGAAADSPISIAFG